MYRFKFFVRCSGWAAGGYENTHFAESLEEIEQRIEQMNANVGDDGEGYVELLEVEEISPEEFVEDFIY